MSSSTAPARTRATAPTTDLALIAVFAALIALLALGPAIPVGALGVPITLQTLGVALTGLVLGPWRGFLATVLYLVAGFAGLPVFAGGARGLDVFAKGSIGYLLSFPIAALVAGAIAYLVLRRWGNRWYLLFGAGFLASILIVHPAGIAGMAAVAKLPIEKATMIDLAYWPGDVLKNLVAGLVASQVHRAFPALAGRR